MLARTTQPEAAANGDLAASAAPRDAAFGRAQRHSRRVRTLKFALPLAAIAIAIAFPLYSYLAAPPAVAISADSSAFADGKLVMANPKMQGLTKQNLPYAMKAVRAVQDTASQNIVQLEGISATLPVNASLSASVDAKHGTYNRDQNSLDLDDAINVTTTDGMVAKLKSAFLDLGKGTMKTDDPVDITRGGSRITSDSMAVEDNGKLIIFEKRVRVNIDPATMKSADNSGEANAVR